MAILTQYREPRDFVPALGLIVYQGADRIEFMAGPLTMVWHGLFQYEGANLLAGGVLEGIEFFDTENGGLQYRLTGLEADAMEALWGMAQGYGLLLLLEWDDTLLGSAGNDTLEGSLGADLIIAGAGDDWLDSGPEWNGVDTMEGGAGNDTFVAGRDDIFIEAAGGGIDTLISPVHLTLPEHFENLHHVGHGGVVVSGNALDNRISSTGNATLEGGAGNDTLQGWVMHGGQGDDLYLVDYRGVAIHETQGEGFDRVVSSDSYELPAGVEVLELVGDRAIDGAGNAQANLLVGNELANHLSGGSGDDTMIGGAGDDTYYIQSPGDVVFESSGADTYVVYFDWMEPLPQDIENLQLADYHAFLPARGMGNHLDNLLSGSNGNDELFGLAGDDTLWGGWGGSETLHGGPGDDVYRIDSIGADVVDEALGEGYDTVYSEWGFVLPDHVEALVLTGGIGAMAGGNDLDNRLTGEGMSNVLDGGAGADTMDGGGGGDQYFVDQVGDVVDDTGNTGIDEVRSTISFDLSAALAVERLMLLGNQGLWGRGNLLPNEIEGNEAGNRLEAVAGDSLYGAGGDDTLLGSSEADLLRGDTGNDSMSGAGGNDVYWQDALGDKVVELGGGGIDTLHSTIDATLPAHVERLVLEAGASVATGTAAGNEWLQAAGAAVLHTGGGQGDSLQGGNGNDFLHDDGGQAWMAGGSGDDTYHVAGVGDILVEASDAGFDTVFAHGDFELPAGIEKLVLLSGGNGVGNAVPNDLVGHAGQNMLDGGLGADTLAGGLGNDTYLVDVPADQVMEAAGAGEDTIVIRGAGLFAIADHVELIRIEAMQARVLGNALANHMTGSSHLDHLDGGAGADTLAGQGGDDVYGVGDAGDVVLESADQGRDTVRSTLAAYVLPANVEQLTLQGPAFAGTGNAGDNRMLGNAGANRLDGAAGADTLSGQEGADTLLGGAGNDSIDGDAGVDVAEFSGPRSAYTVTQGQGRLTVVGADGTDVLIGVDQLRFADQDLVLNLHQASGTVQFSGESIETHWLTAAASAAQDVDGIASAVAYQWFRGESAVEGATAARYLLGAQDIGESMRVRVRFIDGAGNTETLWSQVGAAVQGLDTRGPRLLSREPGPLETAFPAADNLVLRFDETVYRGDGRIVLTSKTGLVEIFDVSSSDRLHFDGNVLTIDPTAILPYGQDVVLAVEQGAVVDGQGNGRQLMRLAFHSETPAAAAAGPYLFGVAELQLPQPHSMDFAASEYCLRGSGTITLRDADSGAVIETFDVSDPSRVFILFNAVQLHRQATLQAGHHYRLEVPAGALLDAAGQTSDPRSYDFGVLPPSQAGTAASEAIVGGPAGDLIDGGGGSDTLTGGGGNDWLQGNGTGGQAVFSGQRAEYFLDRVAGSATWTTQVQDMIWGRDGSDWLGGVDVVRFTDVTVDLTMPMRALSCGWAEVKVIEELYVGFFNRIPEAQGLGYWIDGYRDHRNMALIADEFYGAGVQFGVYSATMTREEFVATVYGNVLGRPAGSEHAPDADEIGYWAALLAQGTLTKGRMVLQMLNDVHGSFENHEIYGFVARHLNNKAMVANFYAVEHGLSLHSPQDNIAFGSQLASLVTPDDTSAALTLIGIDLVM